MDLNISYCKKVVDEYKELINKIGEFNIKKLSLKEACFELGGHNFGSRAPYLFDLNCDNFCATIYKLNGKLVVDDSVELWSDDKEFCLGEKTIAEIEEIVNNAERNIKNEDTVRVVSLEKKIQNAAERVDTETLEKGNTTQLQR